MHLLRLMLGSALLSGVVHVNRPGFSQRWHQWLKDQLAQSGLHLDFASLRLNPAGGIVAKQVRLHADSSRAESLASLDELALNFNWGALLQRRFKIESLELTRARLTLPQGPQVAALEIGNIHARVFLQNDRLQVSRLQGQLGGLQLEISGELQLPASSNQAPRVSAMESLAQLRQEQQRVRRGLQWMGRFGFAKAPRLSLQVDGSLRDVRNLRVELLLEAEGLSYAGYQTRSLTAQAQYRDGAIDLRRLALRDSVGELTANAYWKLGGDSLRFDLASTANLPELAQAFLDNDNLREVVFYEPPQLGLSGIWHLEGPLAASKRPVEVTGRLECGRFGTRGEVFDGLSANIGVGPQGVYIRELLLRHKTGTLAAQTLVHETQGTRYQITLRMDPRAFLPFARMPQTREIIQRFEFGSQSSIDFELTGEGPEPDPQLCLNRGRGDLRRFKYRGLYLDSMQADVEFKHPYQHYRNLRLSRPEGLASASHIEVHDEEKWVRLNGVKSAIDPVGVVSVFGPKTAEAIARYKLPVDTRTEVDGVIYYRDHDRDDFTVNFSHPTGHGTYSFLGDAYRISQPSGRLHFKGETLNMALQGMLFASPMRVKGQVSLSPNSNAFEVSVQADRFVQRVFGRDLNFTGTQAVVADRGRGIEFDIKAGLLDGRVSLKGATEPRDDRRYQGSLRMEDVSLRGLASVYMKGNDSQGDVTSDFRFSGTSGDWSALRGQGSLSILNGDLYSIPIVGLLAPMLGTVLPRKIAGYNIAKEADCTFSVQDGKLYTSDFEALTTAFRMLLKGDIDFLRDELNMDAQVRARGLPGLVFLPFSELLQYKGTGSVGNPKWEPKLLRGIKGSGPSRASGNP
jgi:hypothetical protein